LMPGKYVVRINKGLKYSATHSEFGNRITSDNLSDSLPEIFVYGCSYTYGQGVNDDETYPYLLQQAYGQYSVTNFARSGYGSLQADIQLKNSVDGGERPKVVILGFATFHEERNLLSRSYQEKLYTGYKLLKVQEQNMVYPKCKLNRVGFDVSYVNIIDEYVPFVFREQSVLMNTLDQNMTRFKSQDVSKLQASKRILGQIKSRCSEYDIRLIVADVDSTFNSARIASFCLESEIEYVNISPDLSISGYRNLPYDLHPNKEAHKVYAHKLVKYLNKNPL